MVRTLSCYACRIPTVENESHLVYGELSTALNERECADVAAGVGAFSMG